MLVHNLWERKQGNGVAAANANDDAGESSSSSSCTSTPRGGDWCTDWLGGYAGRKERAVGTICVVFACDRGLEEASIARSHRRALDPGAASHRESESWQSTSLRAFVSGVPVVFGVLSSAPGSP